MDVGKFFKEDSKKVRSLKQEKAVAKYVKGLTTIASGALFGDGDVIVKGFGKDIVIEAKRTDKQSMRLSKDWLVKLRKQSKNRIPVLHLEIQDEGWYLVRPQEFLLILEYLEAIEGKVKA
jgi:hypothetical protein